MGKLTGKEKAILALAFFALVDMVLAVVDWLTGGGRMYDLVQLALLTLILSRVI